MNIKRSLPINSLVKEFAKKSLVNEYQRKFANLFTCDPFNPETSEVKINLKATSAISKREAATSLRTNIEIHTIQKFQKSKSIKKKQQ